MILIVLSDNCIVYIIMFLSKLAISRNKVNTFQFSGEVQNSEALMIDKGHKYSLWEKYRPHIKLSPIRYIWNLVNNDKSSIEKKVLKYFFR